MMITVTITLRGRAEPIVLGYETLVAADHVHKSLGGGTQVHISDDFGQVVDLRLEDADSVVVRDVSKHAALQNEIGFIMLKKAHEFQVELQQHPELRFLVGTPNPMFNKK